MHLPRATRGKAPHSDDRYVRVQARRFGTPSFGTLTALDVLAKRGLISEEQRLSARAQLRRGGAMGVGATLDELIAEARATGWSLSEGVAFSLLDPTAWSPNAVEILRTWGAFLRAGFDEAPERFEI
jgi:hypothetical protein